MRNALIIPRIKPHRIPNRPPTACKPARHSRRPPPDLQIAFQNLNSTPTLPYPMSSICAMLLSFLVSNPTEYQTVRQPPANPLVIHDDRRLTCKLLFKTSTPPPPSHTPCHQYAQCSYHSSYQTPPNTKPSANRLQTRSSFTTTAA